MINSKSKLSLKKEWPAWPCYSEEEIEAATRVLRSNKVNYWTGEEARLFEQEYAQFVGTKYAVALMNGTVALETALYALDIGANDEVITSSRTFIASASAIVMRGATPVLADIDPVSQNITANTIAQVLTPRTKAIIVVHLAGWPCEMDAILTLAKENGLFVIEDCAQAHGASYFGKQVGSMGDIGAFSFCQSKIITTGGEGGMVTTNNRNLWEKMWAFKDHGRSYDAVYNRIHPPGFRWLCESFGTNLRLTEIQAAIGRLQLKKLSDWVKIRQRNASILNNALSNLSLARLTIPPEKVQHAYYQYYFFIKTEKLKPNWNRDLIMQTITERGVPCFSGICSEIYLEKAFEEIETKPSQRLPNAKKLGETSLMLQIHPTLSENDVHDMASIISDVLLDATWE